MKLIRAVELPGRGLYEFSVHLDETKVVKSDDGTEIPDPAWVYHKVWQIEEHPDQTDTEYIVSVIEQLKKNVYDPELVKMQATSLPNGLSDRVEPVMLSVQGMKLISRRQGLEGRAL